MAHEGNMKKLHIIGGGLAGSEAAWQAARRGIHVVIHEMRNENRKTFAHETDTLAELVCSNSFRNDDHTCSAIGLLHEEMRRCGSIIMKCADENKVPAGGALAMDRHGFSAAVQAALEAHPNIEIVREEIDELPSSDFGYVIVATGPLTSEKMAESILKVTGEDHLSFFDAIAPIVHKDSINFDVAWMQSRYDKGEGKDYVNCPMSEAQYYDFIDALLEADKTEFKDWEKNSPRPNSLPVMEKSKEEFVPYFDGCLPIEVMAERGKDTLAFGPMKPVGLTNPHNSTERPFGVVQLRQDNKLGTLYNIVGFQTKMKYGAQEKVFRTIPGLEKAKFARLGGIHRNTFINSPVLLDESLRLKKAPHIRFAGQVTGVEGYVESAASGLMAGRFAAAEILGDELAAPPLTTALGALLNHVTDGHMVRELSERELRKKTFQPMNINFGLFPPFEKKVKKKERKVAYCTRGLEDLKSWV